LKKESFYFSHDANAHIDEKILELRSEYNWEGYGIFWVLIEILRSQTDYTYNLTKMAGLSIAIGKPKQWLQDFIKYCIDLELFVENNGEFYSESLMKRMEQIDKSRQKRAEAGRLGGIAKAKAKQCSSNALAKPSKEKKRKEKKEKESINIYSLDFDHFWIVWNENIKNGSNKKKSFDGFSRLIEAEMKLLFDSVIPYSKSNSEHKFLKRCETYINQRHWEQVDSFEPQQRQLGAF